MALVIISWLAAMAAIGTTLLYQTRISTKPGEWGLSYRCSDCKGSMSDWTRIMASVCPHCGVGQGNDRLLACDIETIRWIPVNQQWWEYSKRKLGRWEVKE